LQTPQHTGVVPAWSATHVDLDQLLKSEMGGALDIPRLGTAP
jgi:hypothetical protein